MTAARVLRPQLLLSALLFVAALAAALRGSDTPALVTVAVATPEAAPAPAPITLVVNLPGGASGGEERLRERVEIPLPSQQPARAAAILAELRSRLLTEGVWPPALPTPAVFVVRDGAGSTSWVVDLEATQLPAVTIAAERALADSIDATARANGASAVAFLVAGRPSATLLGHVAVVNALPEPR